MLNLYVFEVVLAILRKVDRISQYFALFAHSAKYQFLILKGDKVSSSDYYNTFTVLYWLSPMVSEVVKCLGYVCYQ